MKFTGKIGKTGKRQRGKNVEEYIFSELPY
jgi:hypothetical protein